MGSGGSRCEAGGGEGAPASHGRRRASLASVSSAGGGPRKAVDQEKAEVEEAGEG